MRIAIMTAIFGLIAAPALAQTPSKLPPVQLPAPVQPKQEVQAVTTAQSQAATTITDIAPPESGTRWRVHPVRIGNLFLNQIQEERNGRLRVVGYRNGARSMTLSIFNASYSKPARVRVECGSRARLDSRDAGIQEVSENSYWQLYIMPASDGDGSADCSIVSDIPIIVAAFIEDTIREKDSPGYGGAIMQQSTVPWPAFRLNSPN